MIAVIVTVPTLALVVPLYALYVYALVRLGRWLNARYLRPWLRSRVLRHLTHEQVADIEQRAKAQGGR